MIRTGAKAGLVTPASNSALGPVLLAAENLSAAYGTTPILRDIRFDLAAGEFVGLVGPNGAGKSTLLHCLTGYHQASAGEVRLGGTPVAKRSRADIARQIAFVPQFTESVYGFSVREIVLMGRFAHGASASPYNSSDVARADEALEELRVAHLRHRSFGQLSGGERQLVLLARAVLQAAPILLMDEPLTGLDLRHQFEVMQALQAWAKRPGHAVLATFHDLPAAARWCSRMLLLKNGSLVADGSPRDVISPETLQRVYGVSADVAFGSGGELSITVRGVTAPAAPATHGQ